MPAISEAATLADSVSHALQTHPQMKAGEASLQQADKSVWEQKAAFFPTVGLDGQTGRLRNNDETTRGATPDQGAAASWLGQGTVTLTQPLFSGLGDLNRYRGAQDRYSAAEYDLGGRAEDIALRAARAHLNLMRTREMLGLASKFLSNIEDRRKKIALMVKGGAADAAELLQAEEIQTLAKNTRLGFEESFRQAEADYIEVVGSVPDSTLEFGEAKWNAVIPETLEDAVAHALRENPRLLAADRISIALERETRAEKSNLFPRVDAALSYMKKDQADEVGGEATSAQAMVKLGWNFSTGGAQLARIDRSRLQQVETAARRQDLMRNVEHDVRQKFTSMQIVDQQLALLTDRAEASKKILSNFTSQFEGGKQSNLQLIAAHSKLFEAQSARTDAYYRRLLSRFELLNAMGRLHGAFGAVAKTKDKTEAAKSQKG